MELLKRPKSRQARWIRLTSALFSVSSLLAACTGSEVDFTLGPRYRPTTEPGTYQVFFDPPFTLTLSDGWQGEMIGDRYAYFRWTGPGFDGDHQPLIAVQRLDGMIDPDDPEATVDFPEDLAAYITAHPSLEIAQTQNVSIAGFAGVAIDARITKVNTGTDLAFGQVRDETAVYFWGDADVRFIILPVDEADVIVTVEVPCCEQFDEFTKIADEALTTLRFESIVEATAAFHVGGTWTYVSGTEAGLGTGALTSIVPGGDGLLAAGFSDTELPLIWTSPDGVSWRPIYENEGPTVAMVMDLAQVGAQYVAVGTRFPESDTEQVLAGTVWVSNDGITWTEMKVDPAISDSILVGVTHRANGLVAAGMASDGDTARVIVSEDGETWRPVISDTFEQARIFAVAATEIGLVAVGPTEGGSAVWVSNDGETWARTFEIEDGAFSDVVSVGSSVIIVGGLDDPAAESSLPAAAHVWISTDGSQWEDFDPGPPGRAVMEKITLGSDGTLMVAGYDWDRNVPALWMSRDGRQWTLYEVADADIHLVDNINVKAVAPFNSGAVIVGDRPGGFDEDIAIVVWSGPTP